MTGEDVQRTQQNGTMESWHVIQSCSSLFLFGLAEPPPLNLKNSRIPKLCARFTPPGCGVAFDLGQVYPPKKKQVVKAAVSGEPRDESFLVKWIQHDTSDSTDRS